MLMINPVLMKTMVAINIPASLQSIVENNKQLHSSGSSLKSVLDELIVEYPALKAYLVDAGDFPACHVNFYVNNKDIRLLGENVYLKSTDNITIVPAVAGG